jgi:quinoprotein glucose dehydrogenase
MRPVALVFLPIVLCVELGCRPNAPVPEGTRFASASEDGVPTGDWLHYGRSMSGRRFSPLDEIHLENVHRLERAWSFNTGDLLTRDYEHARNAFQCAPLAVDGVLYIVTQRSRVFAVDGASGKIFWKFDAKVDLGKSGPSLAIRGLGYWSDGTHKRLYVPCRDGRLIALDPVTGNPERAFGTRGSIDFRTLLEGDPISVHLSAPPTVHKGVLLQPLQVPDGVGKAPYVPVIAFDAITGEEKWRFDTIPQSREAPGAETWEGESWRGHGAANVWSMISVDRERDIAYLPVSTPNHDFYGGTRQGDNLFSNALVAVDIHTGRRLWHFQTVHHDLWNYDLATYPNLVDLRIDGEVVPALAQPTKAGMIFVLNRVSGEPLFPVEERPVPQSDVRDEKTSPTQPFATRPPPIAKHGVTEVDLYDLDPRAKAGLVERFREYRSDGIYTPPSQRGSVILPGYLGGANWSSASVDPDRGVLYINTNNQPYISQVVSDDPKGAWPYTQAEYTEFVNSQGFPAINPPWGELTAIDLNRGEILWKRVLGDHPEARLPDDPPTGSLNIGGATATAGGLLFIASTTDGFFRSFSTETGEELWKYRLDFAGHAAPVVYRAGGRQYVVISAGGGGTLHSPPGDSVVAFALPDSEM